MSSGASVWAPSRKGTRWDEVLLILVVNRLLSPGSAWRLHREWYGRSALPDLLGMASVIDEHALYDCHDLLLGHKTARFDHLADRWRDLFNISFDVLLYDLTSTYFEIDPPLGDEYKRQFGYSRDHRSECVQVVIALTITPEGCNRPPKAVIDGPIRLRFVALASSGGDCRAAARRFD